MEAKPEEELNSLLDDALDDLIADAPLSETPLQNVQESLKKISEVTGASQSKRGEKIPNHGNTSNTSKGSNKGKSNCNQFDVDVDEMNKFFENMTTQLKAELPEMNPDEARAKINESVPQIFDLMQNLLSKELLYPALKDLSPKFDDWLNKNSSSLSRDDKKRYKKQRDIVNEIIYVFDNETLNDKERFEKNLDLMEKMQMLGAPPDELTVPEGMSRCSVM